MALTILTLKCNLEKCEYTVYNSHLFPLLDMLRITKCFPYLNI